MAVLGLSQDEVRKALTALDQALFHHEQWSEALSRTLICRLTPDQADLAEDAHRRCRFGQWLQGTEAAALAKHPGLPEIASAHERMHRLVRELLTSSTRGETIELQTYERYSNAMKQMQLEIHTIQRELEDAIFNLDPLTGAANRLGMLTKLREQQTLVQRKVHLCAVAMVDFDHFRAINDKFGHAMGDKVLVACARYLLGHLRPYDMLFRYGGEEFLICLPNADGTTARDVVDRLREGIEGLHFGSDDGPTFHITVSCGIALLEAGISVEESIGHADRALYAAKEAGRNRVVAWDASME